jgi:pyridoxal phosphate enzyme (YggS family)
VEKAADEPNVEERVELVRQRIDRAAEQAGRSGSDITLIAVTKTVDTAAVRAVIRAGVTDVGENRVQELTAKVNALADLDQVGWHLIGQLQRNKVRKAVEASDVIHSIDSVDLAKRVSDHAFRLDKVVDLFAQVNVSGEASKAGFTPSEFLASAEQLGKLSSVRWRGLMTIAPEGAGERRLRQLFSQARLLQAQAGTAFDGAYWNALSMGMTDDFESAIAEGATHVRVGRAIFGDRQRIKLSEAS